MENVGSIVNGVLDARGLARKVLEKMAVELWSDVVGDPINHHTLAERFTNGTLYVRVRSPQWTHELHFLEARIVARLNGRLKQPIVQKIRATVTAPPGTPKSKLKPDWEDPTFPAAPHKDKRAPVPTDDAAAHRGARVGRQHRGRRNARNDGASDRFGHARPTTSGPRCRKARSCRSRRLASDASERGS